jgi:ribosomal protein S18 acetylase RimI-like enzyme
LSAYVVSDTVEVSRIRSYLMGDPDYSAYALGDLEDPYAEHARWTAALRQGRIEGLALLYRGLEPVVLFLMGENGALDCILEHDYAPDDVFFTIQPAHRPLLENYYQPTYLNGMYRMRVGADTFRGLPSNERLAGHVVPLDGSHVGPIQELIRAAAAADARELSDVAFSPDMLDAGTYAGVFDSADHLIAVAGTHLAAHRAHIAAVGNVVTHPDHRRKRLGTLVCHHVTKALLEDGFERVVLNVRQDNEPAIRIYQKLGYTVTNEFIEGMAVRTDRQAAASD